MTLRSLLPAIALVCAGAVPATAQPASPRTAQALVDVTPLTTDFADRVLSSEPSARAAVAGRTAAYQAADGQTVAVTLSDAYRADPAIGQSYVDFLSSLTHGTELGKLKVFIDTPAGVRERCGGAEGTLACYNSGTHVMTVPGEQVQDAGDGVTTSYVVAHEYGHHVAEFRANPPFRAVATGPKRWASYERVCRRTQDGQLFPGDEDDHYTENPGESWAETYARLKYPDVAWTFTPLLTPDAGALAAARSDVLTPWTSYRKKRFSGRGSESISFPLNLDGAFRARVTKGKARLSIRSDGRPQGSTRPGQRSLGFDLACRSSAAPVTTIKASGSSFTVEVVYAG